MSSVSQEENLAAMVGEDDLAAMLANESIIGEVFGQGAAQESEATGSGEEEESEEESEEGEGEGEGEEDEVREGVGTRESRKRGQMPARLAHRLSRRPGLSYCLALRCPRVDASMLPASVMVGEGMSPSQVSESLKRCSSGSQGGEGKEGREGKRARDEGGEDGSEEPSSKRPRGEESH